MSTKDIPVFLALMVIGVAFALYQCEQTKLNYLTPSQIVENFYSEWVAYSGEPPARSPIADRIYRNSEYVTNGLINKLDETIASFEQGGSYDPVLCAQDKPRSFSVKESTIEQQGAEVIVEENFGESVREIQVRLVKLDAKWKIDDVVCFPDAETVNLYYYNEQRDREMHGGQVACDPEAVLPVEREIDSQNLIEDTIRLLLEGNLTEADREQGFSTEFPHPEFRLLDSNLENGVLTLTFTEVPGFTTGGSCRVTILKAQVEKTAEQFPQVEEVTIEPETLFQP